LGIAQLTVALVLSAVLLVRTFVLAKSAVVRQQMKWVVWGTPRRGVVVGVGRRGEEVGLAVVRSR
jgi:hypothetical protein